MAVVHILKVGFTPPVYTIDTSTPNNLIFTKNEDLFNYFITLGIQINLYPIALATFFNGCGTYS
jgi:hypothetical protein